ncbi:MAG: GYF domain-containing protein [Chthoniobacter sp.]|uniref:GYF domain-containing protein n=1 Tax=Chthoniobacter sp. TaxID=2510640 RepID=UPI0032A91BA0
MNWYYAQGDQRQGPVSDSELDALLAAGTINENTLVWKEGMANWTALKEARPTGAAADAPPGYIRCTATGRYFPPEEIVYLDGKPYSAAAKPGVLQGVLQTGTLPSSDIGRDGPPWEQRHILGFFPAIWQTIRGALIEPAVTFEKMRREGGLGAPLGYLISTTWATSVVALLYQYLFSFSNLRFPTANGENPAFPMVFGAGFYIGWAIFLPVVLALSSFIGAGILHLSLMLCQGATQPFETTYRTYCYVKGSAAALYLIPVCGGLAGWIWGVVSMCIGISKAHEITTGRAVLAVLLPLLLCCVVFIFVMMAALGAGFAAGSSHH